MLITNRKSYMSFRLVPKGGVLALVKIRLSYSDHINTTHR